MPIERTGTQLNVTSFDSAYEALTEVFPGHPLMPAVRMEYLTGTQFPAISRQVYGPTDEKHNRLRSRQDNEKIFWSCFGRYMQLGHKDYLSWVKEIVGTFYSRLITCAKSHSGKKLVKVLNRIKNAVVRDFRYFRMEDSAVQAENKELDEKRGPEEVVFECIQMLLRSGSHIDGLVVREGFALSKRLCDSYRPLLLRCLCDLIKGKDFLDWLILSNEMARLQTKYRLFLRNAEMIKDWDIMVAENLGGTERGERGGGTIGNKFLESQYGLALMGAVAQLLLGEGHHKGRTNAICALFYYQDYDHWFERSLSDLVENNSVQVGQAPHLDIIKKYPRHFLNYGHFKHTNRLSTYMQPIMNGVQEWISHWDDANVLSKEVRAVLGEQRVGSGSGAAGAGTTSLAEKLHKKHLQLQPRVTWLQQMEAKRGPRERAVLQIKRYAMSKDVQSRYNQGFGN